MQESCSNEADPISCLCLRPQELLEEKLQTGLGKFLVPKILDAWMHNLCNFPKFSFGVHVQPGQTWLKFPIVITKLFVFFFSFWFLAGLTVICKTIWTIGIGNPVIYKSRIHEVNSTGQKDKSVSSSL